MERSRRATPSGGLIPEGKILALRQALARGPVRFKNGATVRRDPDWPADVLVDVPGRGSRRVNEWAHDQIEQAYEVAVLPEKQPPPRPSRRGRSSRDWGPVPF